MKNINELKQLLAFPKDIVITSHRNPDGDAIGSSLALGHYLRQSGGHQVKIVVPSEYPETFVWMPGIRDIIIFDDEPAVGTKALKEAQLIFCLDFNSLDRIDKVGEVIRPLDTKVAMIDHHLHPEPFADFELSDITASSTCELVFDFISEFTHTEDIDQKIAECLYTGIVTDTGSFKYSTSPKLFRIVAQLLEFGVDDYQLQDLIFNSLTEKHLRLLGHCLYNRMEVLDEFNTGIITLTKEDYQNFDIQRGDTEGIVNYILRMRKITMAAFITDQPKIVKISLRSKGDFSVQEIASKHFKGGGHKNASGGYSFQPLSVVLRKFKEILPKYKAALLAENDKVTMHN
ncbi:MAG: bifunctional oligoribonuclease/PAP phosphatase NrnA [Bacteroidota bacterium]